jgi:hypothetical protein
MKALASLIWSGGIFLGSLALCIACEVQAEGPVIGPPPPPPGFVSVDIVGSDGFHHQGYYDDHHVWHGGYYDAHHAYHADRGDWHK